MEDHAALGTDGSRVVSLPLRFMTRHGLIAGTTGTGKSRTMQVIAEQLADSGVDVFVSDVKGDASGFCRAGAPHERNGLAPYEPHGLESNYWSIGGRFIPMRFSLSQIGPVLFARLLSLNSTQESHLGLAFTYARKSGRKLHDLEQLLDILDEMVQTKQRGMSGSSVSVIERKVIALQESGAGELFGRPSIALSDLEGMNVLNLSDARKNMLVSIAPAFLLQVLFDSLPELGDVEKPRYAIFFDEAHYLFKDANKSLKDLMVTILKQIRSKGVAVFFVTQDVTDLPDDVLSQLSTKIIFSQKVFTQKGNRRLKALAASFPKAEMDIMERLKTMSPGVAVVSTLDQGGNQTPPQEVRMFAPATTMEVVSDEELRSSSDDSLLRKYSSKEVPKRKASKPAPVEVQKAERPKEVPREEGKPRKKGPSIWDALFSFLIKLLRFLIKAGGMVVTALLIKPGKRFFRWLTKKPIRILWLLLFLLLLYVVVVNWPLIQVFLDSLKLS